MAVQGGQAADLATDHVVILTRPPTIQAVRADEENRLRPVLEVK